MSSTPCGICNPSEFTEDLASNLLEDVEYVTASDNSDYPSDEEVDCQSDEATPGDGDDLQDSEAHHRVARSVRPGNKHHYRRRNHARDSNSRVLMPTGNFYYIPVVATPKYKCGSKTKLIYLGPNSKKGQREFNIVEKEMQHTITALPNCESTGGCYDGFKILKIQKIVHGCAWRRYQTRKTDVVIEAGVANERMLFHGTDAVWAIVRGGFDERYASTNGQFGAGLYFTKEASLANQFVFGYFGGNGCPKHHDKNCYICERHLLLCRVILGKIHKLTNIQNMPHPPPGHHSVQAVPSAKGFSYDEYVVYRGEQVYPEYLITYKIVRPAAAYRKGDSDDDPYGGYPTI